MSVPMVVELLGTAHAARVLATLDRLGGRARFTPLRDAAGIGDQQLSRALRYLNTKGFLFGQVLAEGDRAPMEYVLTKIGAGVLAVVHTWHETVHGSASPAGRMADAELEALVGE